MQNLWFPFLVFLIHSFRNTRGSSYEEVRREHIESAFVVSMLKAEGANGLEVYDEKNVSKHSEKIAKIANDNQKFMERIDGRIFTKARNLKASITNELTFNTAMTRAVVLVLKEANHLRNMYLEIQAFIVEIMKTRRYSSTQNNDKEVVIAISYSNGYLLLGHEDGYRHMPQQHVKIISFVTSTENGILMFRIREKISTAKKSEWTLSRGDLSALKNIFPDEKLACEQLKVIEAEDARKRKGKQTGESSSEKGDTKKKTKREFPVRYLLDTRAFREMAKNRRERENGDATSGGGGGASSSSASKKSNTKKITKAIGNLTLGKLVSGAKKKFKSSSKSEDNTHRRWDGK